MTTRKAVALWVVLLAACTSVLWAQGTRIEPGALRVLGAFTAGGGTNRLGPSETRLLAESGNGLALALVGRASDNVSRIRGLNNAESTSYSEIWFTSGPSVDLYANGTLRLGVGSNISIAGGLVVPDSATVAGLANGNNNNLDPGARVIVQYSANTGSTDITGFQGGVDGRVLLVAEAASLGGDLRLMNEDANSTAANRIQVMVGGNLTFTGSMALLVYNGSSQRWRAYGLF